MRIRGFVQSRGLVKYSAAGCAAIMLSLTSMATQAVPSKFDTPPCSDKGACYHAVDKKNNGKHETQGDTVEKDGSETTSGTEVFGETVFPNIGSGVSQIGGSTLELGTQITDSLPGSYNDAFDYTGQSSQPDDQIAKLELDQLQAALNAERSWANSIPVPEPATLALMGLGVLGLILLSRRGGSNS